MTKQQGDNESPTPAQSGARTDAGKSPQVEQSNRPPGEAIPTTLYEKLKHMY